jgi:hypothetical protein
VLGGVAAAEATAVMRGGLQQDGSGAQVPFAGHFADAQGIGEGAAAFGVLLDVTGILAAVIGTAVALAAREPPAQAFAPRVTF